jgi:hypothetical protein
MYQNGSWSSAERSQAKMSVSKLPSSFSIYRRREDFVLSAQKKIRSTFFERVTKRHKASQMRQR